MPSILTDSDGKAIPQYQSTSGSSYVAVQGRNNAAFYSQKGSNTQIGSDLTFSWAASAAANTTATGNIAAPGTRSKDGKYLVEIVNPSTKTALKVRFQNVETVLGLATRYCNVGQCVIASADAIGVEVSGWLLGNSSSRIHMTNVTALGSSFSAYARIREINN